MRKSDFLKIKTVQSNLGAEYTTQILNFREEDLVCWIEDEVSRGLTHHEFPKCAYLHFKGLTVSFKVRLEDLTKLFQQESPHNK